MLNVENCNTCAYGSNQIPICIHTCLSLMVKQIYIGMAYINRINFNISYPIFHHLHKLLGYLARENDDDDVDEEHTLYCLYSR